MSAIAEAVRGIFHNFGQVRRKRNEIRKRLRDNLASLERDDDVLPPSSRDFEYEYLGNRAEEKATTASHLIQKYGSESGSYSYRITTNQDEVEKALKDTIKSINRANYLTLFIQAVLIVFVVISVSIAIFLGIAGVETAITQIEGLV